MHDDNKYNDDYSIAFKSVNADNNSDNNTDNNTDNNSDNNADNISRSHEKIQNLWNVIKRLARWYLVSDKSSFKKFSFSRVNINSHLFNKQRSWNRINNNNHLQSVSNIFKFTQF